MSGFAPFGNFWNYYNFNQVEERLQFIRFDEVVDRIFLNSQQSWSILDVVCNEGDLTIAVYDKLQARNTENTIINFLAVDMDNELIQRAKIKSSNITFEFEDYLQSDLPSKYLKEHTIGL